MAFVLTSVLGPYPCFTFCRLVLLYLGCFLTEAFCLHSFFFPIHRGMMRKLPTLSPFYPTPILKGVSTLVCTNAPAFPHPTPPSPQLRTFSSQSKSNLALTIKRKRFTGNLQGSKNSAGSIYHGQWKHLKKPLLFLHFLTVCQCERLLSLEK